MTKTWVEGRKPQKDGVLLRDAETDTGPIHMKAKEPILTELLLEVCVILNILIYK